MSGVWCDDRSGRISTCLRSRRGGTRLRYIYVTLLIVVFYHFAVLSSLSSLRSVSYKLINVNTVEMSPKRNGNHSLDLQTQEYVPRIVAASGSTCVDFPPNYPCSIDIDCFDCYKYRSLSVLNLFRRFLVLGTYENQDWNMYALPPPSRFDSLRYVFAHLERLHTVEQRQLNIVELGTGHSFCASSLTDCINAENVTYWHPDLPEHWDWEAGAFTLIASRALSAMGTPLATLTTVDMVSSHIERNRLMTIGYHHMIKHVVSSSDKYLEEYEGQFDCIYMDTADVWPTEPSAQLHLKEAEIIVERNLIRDGGLVLIDDVRNRTPKRFGESSDLGKSKYSIPYLLQHGFEIAFDGYQVVMKKSPNYPLLSTLRVPNPYAKLKVLHLTFHAGCQKEIEYVAEQLQEIQLQSIFIHDEEAGNAKYNIHNVRAKQYFQRFYDQIADADLIITSDTAPLSRILLQNDYPGKLIVWVCNRFDYADGAEDPIQPAPRVKFPDEEYYNLLRWAGVGRSHTAVIGYTPYENIYARKHRQVDFGDYVIKPTGAGTRAAFAPTNYNNTGNNASTLFIPPYINDERTPAQCQHLGLQCHRGRYKNIAEVQSYFAVLHIPYAWSNFALFEFLHHGVVYIIPSLQFLLSMDNIFWSPPYDKSELQHSEWYLPEHAQLFIFFDSWEDLKRIVADLSANDGAQLLQQRDTIKRFAGTHHDRMLAAWKTLIFRL